jgi:hypothetical protein
MHSQQIIEVDDMKTYKAIIWSADPKEPGERCSPTALDLRGAVTPP